MNLIDQMWNHVHATEAQRRTANPRGAENLWADLNQARYTIHAQAAEISDLREALDFLAEAVQQLTARFESHINQRGTQ